ncbi:MAG: diguanylate cyclase [Coriobacteriia bacterium]|nr:diguanylate cyclase [Coriobacteriia bacterium]
MKGLKPEQYDALLNAAGDVVFHLDAEQRYAGIWGRWLAVHGLTPAMFLGKTSWEIFGEETREFFEPLNERVLAGEDITYERWFDVPWGDRVYYQTALAPMSDADGAITGVVGVGRDITEIKRARDTLEHLATHDALTGLPNRVSLFHALERAAERVARGATAMLVFADIDRFKQANEIGGHAYGDELLADIGRALREVVRAPDIVARIGGDEFAVLMEGGDLQSAMKRADELRARVCEIGAEHGFEFDLSVGIAPIEPQMPADKALKAADEAMYEAKSAGGGLVITAVARQRYYPAELR